MIVLGVDPGVSVTGYAVLNYLNKSMTVLDFGCIRTDSSHEFPFRLKKIYDEMSNIIESFSPQTLALEEIFYAQNIKIALKMGHVRAITLLAAVNHQVPISEFSPREIKQAVTGNGAASKQQVQKMVCQLLNLPQPPSPFDIADAMAAAICYCNRSSGLLSS